MSLATYPRLKCVNLQENLFNFGCKVSTSPTSSKAFADIFPLIQTQLCEEKQMIISICPPSTLSYIKRRDTEKLFGHLMFSKGSQAPASKLSFTSVQNKSKSLEQKQEHPAHNDIFGTLLQKHIRLANLGDLPLSALSSTSSTSASSYQLTNKLYSQLSSQAEEPATITSWEMERDKEKTRSWKKQTHSSLMKRKEKEGEVRPKRLDLNCSSFLTCSSNPGGTAPHSVANLYSSLEESLSQIDALTETLASQLPQHPYVLPIPESFLPPITHTSPSTSPSFSSCSSLSSIPFCVSLPAPTATTSQPEITVSARSCRKEAQVTRNGRESTSAASSYSFQQHNINFQRQLRQRSKIEKDHDSQSLLEVTQSGAILREGKIR